MKFIKRFLRDEKGQALPLFALLVVVIIGFSALAMDWGMHYTSKANYQKAADAAALAAVLDHPGGSIVESSPVGLSMKRIAEDVIAANQKEIDSSAIKVSFPKENQVKVEIALPFRMFLGGAAGFEAPKFTSVGDTDARDAVSAVAQIEGGNVNTAIPLINYDTAVGVSSELELRDKNDKDPSKRDWLDPDLEEFKHALKNGGDIIIDASDGLAIDNGNMSAYLDIVEHILSLPGPHYVFSVNPIILADLVPTELNKSGKGIATDEGTKQIFTLTKKNKKDPVLELSVPLKKDNISPYAKLVDGKYVKCNKGDSGSIDQIVLLEITGAELVTSNGKGNTVLEGTVAKVVHLFGKDANYFSSTSRLVE